jgi:hypothetical protein
MGDLMEEKKITDDVSIEIYDESLQGASIVCHYCDGPAGMEGSRMMLLRENDDGPMYWCTGCGYVLDDGVAMAVRLNEVNI